MKGDRYVEQLIRVDYSGDKPAISARELHEFLGVETPYHKWFPRMCEYGFSDGQDFVVTDIFVHNSNGGPQSMKDAAITIDMAKEICMLQRNEKGKIARQYFLQLERDWNSPEKVMARALQIAERMVQSLKVENARLVEDNQAMQPKALFADSVASSSSTVLIGELAKIIRQNGVDMGEKRLFNWMRENGYLIKRRGTDYNMPTQRSVDMGLFRIKETVISHSDGHTSVNKTPKVTGKGQQYFINLFIKR